MPLLQNVVAGRDPLPPLRYTTAALVLPRLRRGPERGGGAVVLTHCGTCRELRTIVGAVVVRGRHGRRYLAGRCPWCAAYLSRPVPPSALPPGVPTRAKADQAPAVRRRAVVSAADMLAMAEADAELDRLRAELGLPA